MSEPRERDALFTTSWGAPVARVYGPRDVSTRPDDVGAPGEYPYTRGIHPTGHRGRLWTMRQYAGFGTAQDANQRYHYLLQSGTTGLSVARWTPRMATSG